MNLRATFTANDKIQSETDKLVIKYQLLRNFVQQVADAEIHWVSLEDTAKKILAEVDKL